MIVYSVGDKVKIKVTTDALVGGTLEKGSEGIVVALHEGRIEAAFEGRGLISVSHDLIKKKVRKVEKLVKAKNLKLSDEVHIPGSGEYIKIGNIYRNNYDSDETTITVETITYDSNSYDHNELVEVRR